MQENLSDSITEMYIVVCADPSDESVQQAMKEIDWPDLKKELGIERNIDKGAWELAGEIIKAQWSGNEGEWQRICQVYHDTGYNEDEIWDAFELQYDALKRMLRDTGT